MQQTGQWSFEVAPGEQITFRVVPRETQAKSVGVWLDKQKLSSVSQFQPYDEYVWTAPTGSREKQVLMLAMDLIVQDQKISQVSDALNGRGFLTRDGRKWSPADVFNLLPRLIDTGPKIFISKEWITRHAAVTS